MELTRDWISRMCPRVVDMLHKPPGGAWLEEADGIIGFVSGSESSQRPEMDRRRTALRAGAPVAKPVVPVRARKGS
jgi:hypothetical protein